jgi:hypothetical protein
MTADERDEVQMLRERVRIVEAALGLDDEVNVPAEIRRLAAEGRSVQAIGLLRQHTGRSAKRPAAQTVDANGGYLSQRGPHLEIGLRRSSPRRMA